MRVPRQLGYKSVKFVNRLVRDRFARRIRRRDRAVGRERRLCVVRRDLNNTVSSEMEQNMTGQCTSCRSKRLVRGHLAVNGFSANGLWEDQNEGSLRLSE